MEKIENRKQDRIERAGGSEDEVTDSRDIEHRAVGGGFGEVSGEAGDHGVTLTVGPERSRGTCLDFARHERLG